MSAAVGRIGETLRVGPRAALLVTLAALVGIAVVAALATRQDRLPIAVGLGFVTLAMLVSLRWPLVSLLAFAALVPIEEVLLIGGIGTLSRIAGVVFAVTYAVPRIGQLNLRAMPIAGWAYMVWAVASLAWAMSPSTAWAQLTTLMQLFVIAVLVADFVVRQPSIVRPILWAYSISASVAAVIGTVSYLEAGLGITRGATFQDQDPAQFAAVLIPGVVFGIHEAVNGSRRLPAACIAILTTIGVVISGTRGAWLAVAVAALLILPHLSARRRALAIGGIAALLVISFQLPGVSDLVANRTGNALSTGGSGRTDIWSAGLTIYERAPVLGVGFANFPVAYTPDVVREARLSAYSSQAFRAPHNLAVGTLIELGPIGLFLLALLLLPLVLRRGWGADATTIRATLASLLVMAMFLDILANRKQVWLVIGIAAGLAYVARMKAQADSLAGDGSPGQHGD